MLYIFLYSLLALFFIGAFMYIVGIGLGVISWLALMVSEPIVASWRISPALGILHGAFTIAGLGIVCACAIGFAKIVP